MNDLIKGMQLTWEIKMALLTCIISFIVGTLIILMIGPIPLYIGLLCGLVLGIINGAIVYLRYKDIRRVN